MSTTFSVVKTTFSQVKTTLSLVKTAFRKVKAKLRQGMPTFREVKAAFSEVKMTFRTEQDLSFLRKGEGEAGVEGVTMPDTAPRHMLVCDLAWREVTLDLSVDLTNG